MTFFVCPAAICRAPAARVWSLVVETASYRSWVDAVVGSVTPPGRARVGQQIQLRAPTWLPIVPLRFTVEAVDEANRAITLRADFPFGFMIRSRISATPIDAVSCRVQFG